MKSNAFTILQSSSLVCCFFCSIVLIVSCGYNDDVRRYHHLYFPLETRISGVEGDEVEKSIHLLRTDEVVWEARPQDRIVWPLLEYEYHAPRIQFSNATIIPLNCYSKTPYTFFTLLVQNEGEINFVVSGSSSDLRPSSRAWGARGDKLNEPIIECLELTDGRYYLFDPQPNAIVHDEDIGKSSDVLTIGFGFDREKKVVTKKLDKLVVPPGAGGVITIVFKGKPKKVPELTCTITSGEKSFKLRTVFDEKTLAVE